MTSSIMKSWLNNFNFKMTKQKRKVILFLDNSACHPHFKLSNVKIVFIPPNTTNVLQPMDQGIMQNFRIKYRKQLLTKLFVSIYKCENVTEVIKEITVLDAIYWIKSTISLVSSSCVTNCFKKAGFPLTKF